MYRARDDQAPQAATTKQRAVHSRTASGLAGLAAPLPPVLGILPPLDTAEPPRPVSSASNEQPGGATFLGEIRLANKSKKTYKKKGGVYNTFGKNLKIPASAVPDRMLDNSFAKPDSNRFI